MQRKVIDLLPQQLDVSPTFREWVWRCALQGHVSRPTVRRPLLFAPMPPAYLSGWAGGLAIGLVFGFVFGLYFATQLHPAKRPVPVPASRGTVVWKMGDEP
jgi:hypothetical protein